MGIDSHVMYSPISERLFLVRHNILWYQIKTSKANVGHCRHIFQGLCPLMLSLKHLVLFLRFYVEFLSLSFEASSRHYVCHLTGGNWQNLPWAGECSGFEPGITASRQMLYHWATSPPWLVYTWSAQVGATKNSKIASDRKWKISKISVKYEWNVKF